MCADTQVVSAAGSQCDQTGLGLGQGQCMYVNSFLFICLELKQNIR